MGFLTSDADALAMLSSLLPSRNREGNKGDFGKLTVVAGSSFYRGAARLAVIAALRCGVGLVRLASIEPVIASVAAGVPECTFLPVEAASHGGMLGEDFRAKLPLVQGTGAFLVGCGMMPTADTAEIASLLLSTETPCVMDADALNSLCQRPELLRGAIITPHIGEMARLTGRSIEEIKADRRQVALAFASTYGCVTVLKDAVTVIASPDGTSEICDRPNDGLAKGGSGDVLAGIIASLLAQRLEPYRAAVAGVLLHSLAAAKGREVLGAASMLPSDLPAYLSSVYLDLRKE